MPIEEFLGALGELASSMAADPPVDQSPDFGSDQCCDPPSDPEQVDGSYADPGSCVCYDEAPTPSEPATAPAPPPVTGDKPPSAPSPAPPATAQPPPSAAPEAPPPSLPPPSAPKPSEVPTEPEASAPLARVDYRFFNARLDFSPAQLFVPGQGPWDISFEVNTTELIRHVLDLNPDPDAPSLPTDEARSEVTREAEDAGVLDLMAELGGAGGVSSTLNEVILTMAQDDPSLTEEERKEYERRMAESSTKLLVELTKAITAQRATGSGGGKGAPRGRRSPTLAQVKQKLEQFKQKHGQPTKELGDVNLQRWTVKPDKPARLGKTGPDEATGIFHEKKNVQVIVKSDPNNIDPNTANLKSVEIKVSDIQKEKPSPQKETRTFRQALKEVGLIPADRDAGHIVQRALMTFEDPANYLPEGKIYNQHWKNLWVEFKSRRAIRASGGKDSMTLQVIQELSQGPAQEVISTRHVVTRKSDGKIVVDITLDAAGNVTDNSPAIP